MNDRIIAEAISWQVKIESQNHDQDRVACHQWRQQDPRHEQAWQQLQQMNAQFESFSHAPSQLLQDTLIQTHQQQSKMSRRQALKWISGTGVCGAVAAVTAVETGAIATLRADYYTSTGERHPLDLGANTQAWLNTDTAIKIQKTNELNQLHLLHGEVYIDNSNSEIASCIETDHGRVLLTNSKVIVRNEQGSSQLHVMQGSAHYQPKQELSIAQINAGEGVRLDQQPLDYLDTTRFDYGAWIEGELRSNEMPLHAFIHELSRYRTGIIRFDDRLRNHLISGVFQLQDTDLILNVLARTLGSKLRYYSRFWVQLS